MSYSSRGVVVVASFFALVATGCAAEDTSEPDRTGDEISGAPGQQGRENDRQAEQRFAAEITKAYEAAEETDFVPFDGLKPSARGNEAQVDYQYLKQFCTQSTYRIAVHTWNATVPTSVTDNTPQQRRFLVLSLTGEVYGGGELTKLLLVYDERGGFFYGKNGYGAGVGAAFHESLFAYYVKPVEVCQR